MFHANGKQHSRMRKMINPALKMNNLKYMVEVFDEKAKLLTKVDEIHLWQNSVTPSIVPSHL